MTDFWIVVGREGTGMPGSDTESAIARRLQANDEDALTSVLVQFGPAIRAVLAQKYRGLLDFSDFEDVLAIALFRLWTNRSQFNPARGTLRVWFFRITANVAQDVLRHGWQKTRQLEVGLDAVEMSESSSSNSRALHRDVAVLTARAVRSIGREGIGHEGSGRERPGRELTGHDPVSDGSADADLNGADSDADCDPASLGMHPRLREMLELLPDAQRRIVLADAQSREGQVSSQQLATELGIPAATVRVYRRRAIQKLKNEMERRGWSLGE